MEALLPPVSLSSGWTRVPARTPAAGTPRRRVGLLLGCVQRVFFDEVNRATIRVLAAEGCEVVVPRTQGCCGALMLHAGLDGDAADMARRFIDAFEAEAADVDTLVVNAAGCGSTLKEYGHLLRDDPATPSAPAPSRTSARTSRKCWTIWSLRRRDIPCRCASPGTTPATCSTRRG